MIEAFHFLRPAWLLALLPALWLVWRLWQSPGGASGWQRWIRPELLPLLLERPGGAGGQRLLLALAAGWGLAVLALAGPTWERLPEPLYRTQQARVLILDLSPSMRAGDLKPSRIVHARHRLTDLINSRREGLTGLVVYAADAHVVSPLSHDRRTLLALTPTLSPDLMPAPGSRVEAAIEEALALLKNGRHTRGELLLITDGIAPEAEARIGELLGGGDYRLSILGVGTTEGAPVPLADGRFARDSDGNLHLARLQPQRLARLARAHGGVYRPLAFDGSDVQSLNAQLARAPRPTDKDPAALEQHFDRWAEAGPWLVLLLLPIAALAHRRGWLLLLLITPLTLPQPAHALEWQDLWLTPDQQGARALEEGDPERASRLFASPQRQASALYQQQAYPEAAERFAEAVKADPSAVNHYNHGNALARAGELDAALAAYDRALALAPGMEDARFNRQLVEQLRQQQSEQRESQSQQEQQQQQQQQQQQSAAGQQPDQGQAAPRGAEGDQEQAANQGQESEPQSGGQQVQQQSGQPRDEPQGQQPGEPSPPPQAREASPSADEQAGEPPPSTSAGQEAAPAEQARIGAEPVAPEGEAGEGDADPALERWLRQLPEDPGGLLRRKFAYEYQRRQALQGPPGTPPPQRW
ncbi:VWA domain-containing protein [Motiliproteus sp. SC1-56]|uniref:VWA domain-containing protein n=1 Tax=Motiliproteus sp. SC1-56 TaxID=2799565 RepID=UPI001A8D6D23|nr:VWA domain-containing protein [Motiliproteus sp. SC1-56]